MEKAVTKAEKLNVVLKDLLENTTLHGLPRISSSKFTVVRILWFCVFVAAFVLFVLQLDGLIKEYNSNPKQTTITLQSGTVKFPAITICNMNVVKQSNLNLHDQLSDLANSEDIPIIYEDNTIDFVPQITDIYEAILDGYTISKDFHDTHFPWLSYWELVEDLRFLYYDNNPNFQKVDLNLTRISGKEIVMLIGELIETPSSSTNTSNESVTQSPTSTSTTDPGTGGTTFPPTITLKKSREFRVTTFGNDFDRILDTIKYKQPIALAIWETRTILFDAIIRQQSREFRFSLGHQVEDLMLSVKFGGRPKNITYKHYWTKDYGNCYTIDSPIYETRHSGPGHGFDFLLNLEMDEYISNLQESQGVRIVLHEQGTVPFPNAEGITLAPGYEHQIGLKMVETSRLGPPYGTCTDGQTFRDKYKTNYTLNTCTEICKTELYISECGCMQNDSSEILDKYVDLQVCKFSTNSSVKACVERIQLKLDGEGDICGCIEPCRTTAYLKTISGRPWPTDTYLNSVIVDSLCDYDGQIMPSMIKICHEHWQKKLDVQKYRNNFMKIQIYFEDTQYQVITEEATYGVVRFLSDIGGTAGLFIGASMMSIVEIVQVVMEVMLHFRKRHQLSPEHDMHTRRHNSVA